MARGVEVINKQISRGRFITLEGGEGAGKTTQIRHLVEFLKSKNIKVIATREVGGCPSAEEIRELWLNKEKGHWDSLSEVLLIMAARREHLAHKIWPALEEGSWVVSDRYVDSTRVYQGFGLGLGLEKIDRIYAEIAGDFWPDLTLYLDLPVEVGAARVQSREGQDDRYQQEALVFHQTLRDGFLALAEKDQDRFAIIDAAQDEVAVAEAVRFSIQHSAFRIQGGD